MLFKKIFSSIFLCFFIQSSDINSAISNATKEANNDAKLFATFDFMQAMNQLLYGNLDDNERSKLLVKMKKIAQSV
ncbi:hypothetical protein [Campylobacter devanensis]|uniref:hypothetical protein n=1 Tax=Campylobacter devanensis TaxID=3161138 RepID=UPI001F46E424|nr:hypothetical protein [Campylobacter sp. P090]